MRKFTKNSNWVTLSAFGGSGYRKASADNNKKKHKDRRKIENGVTPSRKIGRAGLIEARQIQDKKDGIVARRNVRRET